MKKWDKKFRGVGQSIELTSIDLLMKKKIVHVCLRGILVSILALCVSVQAQSLASMPSEKSAQVVPTKITSNDVEKKWNYQSDRYEINQKYEGGPAFYKDNNIWVYNQKFADLFGMPKAHVMDIQGFEAAAFRVEDAGYKRCGMAGREENCMPITQCTLDVYIDEDKFPLPWSTNVQSDRFENYTSLRWLRLNNKKIIKVLIPDGVKANEVLSEYEMLHPFADSVTMQEAIWLENSGIQKGKGFDNFLNFIALLGYKRKAINNVTLLSFNKSCTKNSRLSIDILLEVRKEIMSPTLKQFHAFVLPPEFTSRMNQALEAANKRDAEFYRSLFVPPLKEKKSE